MSDANNYTHFSNGQPRPEGFGGVIPGQGRPLWVLTDEYRETITTAGRMGYRIKDIGPLVGLSPTTFDHKKREFPEIDDLIEEGRRQMRRELLDISRSTIGNIRDPARNQELARLHRIAKTEEPESAKDSDDTSALGFTVQIIPNKTASNTANNT